MTRPRGWTDAQLIEAAATSHSLREVYPKLGLRNSGGAHRDVTRAARRLGITLPMGRPPGRGPSWTDDALRQACAGATTITEVTRRLGLAPNGQENELLRRHIRRLGLPMPNGRPR
jgi:hypothetical protein